MSKEKCRKEIEDKIRVMKIALEQLELLPDSEQFDFPVKISISAVAGQATLHVNLPYNIKALRQYRRAMGRGWKQDGKWIDTHFENELHRHNCFYRPKLGNSINNPFEVMLSMLARKDSSICHIEQVGVTESPVWKVVCE